MMAVALPLVSILGVVVGIVFDCAGFSDSLGVHPSLLIFSTYAISMASFLTLYVALRKRGNHEKR